MHRDVIAPLLAAPSSSAKADDPVTDTIGLAVSAAVLGPPPSCSMKVEAIQWGAGEEDISADDVAITVRDMHYRASA